jgi:hypothetical protein
LPSALAVLLKHVIEYAHLLQPNYNRIALKKPFVAKTFITNSLQIGETLFTF